MCWSIDYREKTKYPSTSKQTKSVTLRNSFWRLETTRLGLCDLINKETVACWFCPHLLPWQSNTSHHAVECCTVWCLALAWCQSPFPVSRLPSRCPSRHPHAHSILWASIFTLRWKHPRLIRVIFHTVRSQQVFFFFWKERQLRELGLPLETWMCVCFCSLWFILSFSALRFKWGSVCWVLSTAVHCRSRWPSNLCVYSSSWHTSSVLRCSCLVHVCLQEEI